MAAHLAEHVDGCRHVACPPPWGRSRSGRCILRATSVASSELPFRLYRDEPNWVAPLIFERKQFLDRRKNPFFEHGRAEYFLALRDGRPVGRITAQVDDNFQRFQDNRWGWFGFFECEQDPEAAGALLDRAEQWLRGQGCDRMVGPADFTTNDECGVLTRGPRAHAADPLALDAPLLPGRCSRAPAWPRRWTC